MATSSTKKTAKPEGAAVPAKKPRAVKTAAPKDPAAKPAKKVAAKTKAAPALAPTELSAAPQTPPPAAPAPAKVEKVAPEIAPAPTTAPAPAAVESGEMEMPTDETKIILMKPPIQVRDLATRLNLKPFQLIHELMEMNVFATLNQNLE